MSNNQSAASLNDLQQLPAYANYLVTERLDDYVKKQLHYSFEIDIPLLKFFLQLSGEQRYTLSWQSSKELLIYLSKNQAAAQIEASLHQWKINQLPVVDRDSIAAEDITLINYVRKKSMMDFITDYTNDTTTIIALINEIDFFIIQSITAATNLYINLFRERLEEHSHFIQKVAETIPGAVYVFDATAYKGIYSNNKLTDVIGYDHADLNALGEAAIPSLIHPDDQAGLHQQQAVLKSVKDGEVLVSKYRIKKKDGDFKWLANYESVFKRKEDGAVWQTIGITLDIDKQEKAVEELHRREQQLSEAQDIAQLGNFYWDFENKGSTGSPKTLEILEITREGFADFTATVHPDDKEKVTQAITKAFTTGDFNCEYRIKSQTGNKMIWARGLVDYKAGKAIGMTGTVMDVTEHNQLVQKLAAADERHQQAEVIANMGSWNWETGSGKLEWSDQLYRIYGMQPQEEEITIERFLSFVHPHDRAYIEKAVHDLNTETVHDYTFRIITKAGTKKWLRSIAHTFCDETGNIISIIGTEQDVTEKEELIERLRESEKLYKQAQSLTHMGNWTWEFATKNITWSDELFEIYELPEKKPLTQEQWRNYLEPADKDRLDQAFLECMEEHKPMDIMHRLILPGGKIKSLHRKGEIIFDTAGNAVKMVGTTQDVTEQQHAIALIKDQQYFIQQLADASPTILYLFDVPTQSFAYINREAFFVLGYLPDEILEDGAFVTELLYHPDDIALLPCRRQSTKSFQQVDSMIQYECRMKHKDGEYRWLLVREIVFKSDDAGAITQITGAALDINRRKEMEKTILQNTLQLEQSNASLEEFAYVASHDLKEPLRKISTFGDRLAASQADKLTDEGKVYLTKIIDASQRMQNMISDLLSISMISGNRSFENYSLEKILEETLQTLEIKIEHQNAVIHHDPLPDAKIVPLQFRQLFQNLISNSLKFVREGIQPEITITCHTLLPTEVANYQVAKAEGYFAIVFADNGIGFESEYAQKIFAIFQRLHGRSEYEGSGIGLAICKKIVEHHGGVIFATSQPDAGATFTIILPI